MNYKVGDLVYVLHPNQIPTCRYELNYGNWVDNTVNDVFAFDMIDTIFKPQQIKIIKYTKKSIIIILNDIPYNFYPHWVIPATKLDLYMCGIKP